MNAVQIEETDRGASNMLDIVRQKMSGADYFISVVTYKRAWEPEGMGGKSLAEIEFDLAQELKKPSAILLPQDDSQMAMYLRMRALLQSPMDRLAQQAFWKRLEQIGDVHYFADETDLAQQISQILESWAGIKGTVNYTQDSDTVIATGTVEPQPPLRERQTFAPESTDQIDTLAERIAEKVAQIQQARAEELAKEAVKVNEALRLMPGELVFGRPSKGSQFKSDAFMIMPFAPAFNGIYVDIIKPMMADLKLTILRGDDFNSSRGVIIDEVWAALNACQFVIAEITGGNDNVFYELGIAHTLNKPAILITQAKTPEGVPFDIRHLRYIQYDNTAAGGTKLREDLERAITLLRKRPARWLGIVVRTRLAGKSVESKDAP